MVATWMSGASLTKNEHPMTQVLGQMMLKMRLTKGMLSRLAWHTAPLQSSLLVRT